MIFGLKIISFDVGQAMSIFEIDEAFGRALVWHAEHKEG